MKKTLKKFVYVMVLALLVCSYSGVNGQEVVHAQTSKVTSGEKGKIKKLCKEFTVFLAMQLNETDPIMEIPVGKSTTWKFQDWNKEDLNYKYNMIVPLGYMSDENAAKRVFGISDFYVTPEVGDWGEAYTVVSLKSVSKKSSSKYVAVCDVKWVNEVENTTQKWGTATFTLKKKKGTYYGFVVKSVKIKKIKNI